MGQYLWKWWMIILNAHSILMVTTITGTQTLSVTTIAGEIRFFQHLLELISLSCCFQINIKIIPSTYNLFIRKFFQIWLNSWIIYKVVVIMDLDLSIFSIVPTPTPPPQENLEITPPPPYTPTPPSKRRRPAAASSIYLEITPPSPCTPDTSTQKTTTCCCLSCTPSYQERKRKTTRKGKAKGELMDFLCEWIKISSNSIKI